jgi:signal transduction histidine kinase
VFVAGASDLDRAWHNDAVVALQPFLNKYETKYLVGFGYDVLVREVSQLPRDSIVMLMPIFDDGRGVSRIGSEVALDIAGASSAPVYSPVATLFGGGIVGGNMDSLAKQGVKAADFALEILSGKSPSELPHETKLPLQYRVDARQLDRWRLREASLPPGTSVEFREPQLWEQYKTQIVATLLAIGGLVGIIALLLAQMRKRRQAERSLKESEDRMAFAAAYGNIGFWSIDIATGRLWATEHCRAMFGIARDAPLTWDSFRAAVHPDDRQAFMECLQFAARAGLPGTEFRITLPGRGVRWYECRGRTLADDTGAPFRVSGVFADVNARKTAEAEAELQRNEITHLMRVAALGELSGGIAHEISQPLAAILANAQAAQAVLGADRFDKEMMAQILEDIVEEDRRAGQVIHRLRRLLKKGERQSVLLNLNELVHSTMGLLRSELLDRRITLKVDLRPALPLVSGDAVQLQQVLLNLMMNSMEAMSSTPQAERKLSVATQVTREAYVEIVLSDRGCGFTTEELRRIFQPFFTTKQHGLGLGLPICSTIITSHGGRLTVSNSEEGGATAHISLPAAIQMAAAS